MNLLILAAAVTLAQQTASPYNQVVAQAAAPQADVAAPVQWVGADSKHSAGFFMINDAAAWSRLWAEHLGLDGEHGAYNRHLAPHVDFNRYLVIAYFRGPSTNRDGEVLASITTTPIRPPAPMADKPTPISVADFYPPPTPLYTVLRFDSSTFQSETPSGKGIATSSYGIWLIPIPPDSTPTTRGNAFIIQEGRRGLKNEPVRYEEVFVLQPGC